MQFVKTKLGQGKKDRDRGRRRKRRRRWEKGRRGKRRQKIHKTKAVVDDRKSCEYKFIMLLFHLKIFHILQDISYSKILMEVYIFFIRYYHKILRVKCLAE